MPKRIRNSNLYVKFIIALYIIVSIFLLGNIFTKERETAIYDMGVVWKETSENLGNIADYRQWFYAPCECSGIQLAMATDQTEAQKDLIVRIYDASNEEWVGECIVSSTEIRDNQYVEIMFEKFALEEGNLYFFDAYTNGEGENPLHFWVGTTDSEFCLNAEYIGETLHGTALAFNLIYDYTNKNFVIWMFVSIVFWLMILKKAEEKNVRKRFRKNG